VIKEESKAAYRPLPKRKNLHLKNIYELCEEVKNEEINPSIGQATCAANRQLALCADVFRKDNHRRKELKYG